MASNSSRPRAKEAKAAKAPAGKTPAFRCKKCGFLEVAEQAGENELPHACPVCGGGVVINPRAQELARKLADPETSNSLRQSLTSEFVRVSQAEAGTKVLDPDNWEVLADLPETRLKKMGLSKKQVVRHSEKTGLKAGAKPLVSGTVRGNAVKVGAGEAAQIEDRAG
jgi:DNA-directed RNA polymerase subunit RPC12/RpoP